MKVEQVLNISFIAYCFALEGLSLLLLKALELLEQRPDQAANTTAIPLPLQGMKGGALQKHWLQKSPLRKRIWTIRIRQAALQHVVASTIGWWDPKDGAGRPFVP